MTSLFGLIGGLVVGIGVRVLLGRLDRSVRSASMLSAVAGVPILATVPESASRGFRALTFPADGATAYAESIRKLRTGIEFAGPSADAIRSVLIASPRYSEPAGCIAADLAVVLSEAGRRVLLVDGDLRSPSLDSYLGIKPAVGFSDVLAGAIPLVDVLVQVPGRSLTLLPAGSIRSDSGDAIASVSAREMLSEASEKFEYTIVVGPPLSLYSDSAVIAQSSTAWFLFQHRVFRRSRGGRRSDHAARCRREPVGRGAVGCRTGWLGQGPQPCECGGRACGERASSE